MSATRQPEEQNSNPAIPPWSLESITNVGMTLPLAAERMGDAVAVAAPIKKQSGKPVPLRYEKVSFTELETRSNQIAAGIQKMKIKPGTRLALMVPPGLEFVAQVFGLFKAGIVIILIDPGMGRANMVKCLSAAEPEGIVGIPLAQIARVVKRKHFPKCKHNVVVGRRWWPGCTSAEKFRSLRDSDFQPISNSIEDPAAIIFTTGSTGPPKGVLYRHRIFIQQARQIRDYFGIQPGTVDVSGFPLFALFNAAMGATTVFPEMDPTRPASIHPPYLIDAVNQFKADQSFGSPALWNTVSKYCEETQTTLPGMKRVLSAGAPVPAHVMERVRKIIAPDGDVFTPYGATESLPVACNSATVVLNETAAKTDLGHGTCVGQRFPDIQWRVIEINDHAIAEIEKTKEVPRGTIGELIVRGPVVTDQYVTRAEANAYHKVTDGDSFWHRMGDVGYLDDQDRFWFCGRKGHRVILADQTLFTIPCEGIINTHPKVYRSALIGIGPNKIKDDAMIVVELWPQHYSADSAKQTPIIEELKTLASQHETTRPITKFVIRKALPVDIRHNSKIFREQLAAEYPA